MTKGRTAGTSKTVKKPVKARAGRRTVTAAAAMAAWLTPPLPWQPEEIEVLRPRPRLSTYDWALEHRVLPRETAQFAGRWTWDYVPFWVEVAEAWDDPRIRSIAVQKPSQSGFTELANTIIGRTICEHPQPTMIVMPDKEGVERRIRTRIRPMFQSCPELQRHLPGGNLDAINSGQETLLDNMILYIAWASSPAALADNPVCNIVLDEVDKYAERAGKEADPLSLAAKRQRTFLFAKSLIGSTPTDESGHIHRACQAGDRRRLHVPCPHCKEYQILQWANVQLDHDDDKHLLTPAEYAAGGHARYACPQCGAVWAEHERWSAVLRGIWATDGCTVETVAGSREPVAGGGEERRTLATSYHARRFGNGEPDAVIIGDIPQTENRSYYINALYLHPAFVSIDKLASSWSKAQIEKRAGNIGPLIDFINSELGEIWQEAEGKTDAQRLAEHIEPGLDPDLVPRAAICLTAGVDVQDDHLYLDVWAWGYLYECWLISSQRLETGRTDQLLNWQPLADALMRTFAFKRLEGEAAGQEPRPLPISMTFIDSGFNTDIVYDFCRLTPAIDVRPTKGTDKQDVPYKSSVIDYHPTTGRAMQYAIRLWLIGVEQYKDRAARLLNHDVPGPGYSHLPAGTNADTLAQLTSEHKKILRDGHGRTRRLWVVRPGQTANHRWDTFVLALAAAEVVGVRNIPPPGTIEPPDEAATTRITGKIGGRA